MGCRSDCASEKGARLLAPYTELEEPKINRETWNSLHSSSKFTVPATFTCSYSRGCSIDGRTPARARKMNDRLRPDLRDDLPHAVHRANVHIEKFKRSDFPDRFEIRLFPRGGVELVEVINDAQGSAVAEQCFRQMRADEAGSTRQQYALWISAHATIPLGIKREAESVAANRETA